MNADGSFTYTPDANYNGSDSFTYQANDGSADSNVATVSLDGHRGQRRPGRRRRRLHASPRTRSLTVAAPGVLANDTRRRRRHAHRRAGQRPGARHADPQRRRLVHLHAGRQLQRRDSFTYKANDGSADSNVATVSLTVTAVNDAPVAAGDAYAADEDSPLTVAAPGVLGNDTDVDGDTLSAVLVSGPAHGTLTFNGDGSFTYTPDANYNGPDSFTYKANDGSADSNVATVVLTVVRRQRRADSPATTSSSSRKTSFARRRRHGRARQRLRRGRRRARAPSWSADRRTAA